MIDTGKYQNQITSLSALGVRDYERIFKIFEQSVNDKDFYVYNILNKIEFPEIDAQYVEYYTTPAKLALTIVSYNIYQDIKSWWIIYLLNKDKFTGAPFYLESGTQVKYILDPIRVLIYQDITNNTILGGRHF